MILFISFILSILLNYYSDSTSILTSFQPNKLKIHLKHKQKYSNVIEQTIYLIRTHFIKKHLYTNQDWEKYKNEMYAINDTKKVYHFIYISTHYIDIYYKQYVFLDKIIAFYQIKSYRYKLNINSL